MKVWGLCGLREGVELAGIHAAGNHEVAGAFRRRFDQERRFNLEETLAVKIVADLVRHPVAEHQRALERTAAQVEIAIAGADILAAIRLVLDGEGRGHRRVEYAEVRKPDLDVARRQFGVLALAFLDHARGLDDELTAQGGHRLADLRVGRIVHAQLRDAVAVADVNETHTAHPAAFLYPSRQGHGLTHVAETKFTTSMCPVHIDYKLGRFFFRECIIRLPRASSAAHLK